MIPLLQFSRLPYQNYNQKIPKTGNSWVVEGHNHDWHLEKLLLPIDLKEKFWSSYKSVLLFIIHFKCSIVDRFGMILQVCSLFVRARCIAWFSITRMWVRYIMSYSMVPDVHTTSRKSSPHRLPINFLKVGSSRASVNCGTRWMTQTFLLNEPFKLMRNGD